MRDEVAFSRNESLAKRIVQLIEGSAVSLDAALYRFNNPRLAASLAEAAGRGIAIRIVIDGRKYQEDPGIRKLLHSSTIPFRLSAGRTGAGSKMHHKFAILDTQVAITGSYNWTLESEEDNYENLVILHDLEQVETYRREFELLWAEGSPAGA